MDKLIEIFSDSLQTGYVDKTHLSDPIYQPELLVNKFDPPKKVLTSIIHELENCSEFYISVAFVTTSGIASIINKLKELEYKKIPGKILVSQYLNFTQPEALTRLLQFKNIDLRITIKGNAHSKGYIFKNKNHFNLIIGSSNLTAGALATNKEWNMKVSALNNSAIVDEVISEFNTDFEAATSVNEAYIKSYNKLYQGQFILRERKNENDQEDTHQEVTPNSMQMEALINLKALRKNYKNKALIISATGTGKTYLSAFDAKAFNPGKLLFVVHRLTIAEESLKTFKKVFGKSRTMGLYSGARRDLECDFIFSTVQTIAKSSHLNTFSKNHFDYIIIDETHRSGAASYQRLVEYFSPQFLLGMTATPERTDGNDIFELFDHNIAYEIRLHRAMKENMLSPFHYYGITDLYIDDQVVDKKSDFNLLISSERVERIIEHARFYGSDNGITRGLIFCSKKKEAIELSSQFNLKGFKTIALTGDSSESERSEAIKRLESNDITEKLDYIFTVDIFNEGIDIPKINQIIMLRPTESAIIFIQQLGRGLRKIDEKKYLTVIDFIGNYENNYLIPVALYGDTSFNKDTLRKLITEGSKMIPGTSTINFDQITKERIFQSIDSANMQTLKDLRKDFNLLKFKLGRLPMMMDFIEHGSRDPFLYVNYSNSYFNFIKKVEKGSTLELPPKQNKLLELFSKEINNSKRVEESIILKKLIKTGSLSIEELRRLVFKKYGYKISDDTIVSCISNLNFEFIREKKGGKMLTVKEAYNIDNLSIQNGGFILSEEFQSFLENGTFKTFLLDSANYAVHVFDKLFDHDNWSDGFVLYRKYSRKDVFRILNAPTNPVAQNVGGYMVSPDLTNCPIFVNYHKEDHISESTKYEDEFVNHKEFDWMSKSNRKLDSKDVQAILGQYGDIRLPLFIKKNNDEGMEFYYMGDVHPELNHAKETKMNSDSGKQVSVVKIRFNLENPVAPSIYKYFHQQSQIKQIDVNSPLPSSKPSEIEAIAEKSNYLIPLYDFYAAAGSFSEMQSEKNFTLIEGPKDLKNIDGYFACIIMGESMNRTIPNGSIALFKTYSGGSRNGKIVLVEHMARQDPDFHSAFTVKTYWSEKVVTENGWHHKSITLKPNSFDPIYKDLIVDEESGKDMRVVGEFIRIIQP